MPGAAREDGRSAHPAIPDVCYCSEKHQLIQAFLGAIKELISIQRQQTEAVIQGDPDFSRFEVLLHVAGQKKEQLKYELLSHVDSHHC